MRYILIIAALFCSLPQISSQNNIAYGAGISYTNGAPSFTPPARTSRVAIDTITGKWYHFNTPGGWQLLGNTIEEIAGCSAPAYTPTKGDSKVVINNCAAPELYYWTGSAWVWINEGTTYYAGEGIRIQNDSIILDSLYYLQFRTGDTTDLDAGRLSWNAQEGTLDVVINSGNVTGQIFEDVFFNCKNQTGSTITRGTVVMAVGTLGASGRILIAPAIADGSVNSEYILGTAAQDIANGADGLVYHFGKDRGLNTTGASCGETWADRDVLYCSATTAGCLTKTVPTAPNLKVPIAIVINAANNGTLFVRPSHFPDLNQINDVQLTSPTTGQTLIYNSVTGVWSNQTPSDPSSTNELQTLSVAANTATLSNSGGSVTIAGAGINTVNTTGTTITVTGTEVDGSVSNELQTLSTGTNTLTLSNGGGTVTVDTDPGSDINGNGVAGWIPQYSGTTTIDTTGLFWNQTTGRLGVRVANPVTTVDVLGDFEVQNPALSYDGGVIGSELLTTGSGTGWTGTSFITGYTHATGNTASLVSGFSPVNGSIYQIIYTVTSRTTGSFTFSFGGFTSAVISSNVINVNVSQTASSTAALTITPTTDFNGTVVFRIALITQGNALFIGKNFAGTSVYELRASGLNSNLYQGLNAGAFNTTGASNVGVGANAMRSNTTGGSNLAFGGNALFSNTRGNSNVGIGGSSVFSNTIGINNIGIGNEALFTNTTGNTNIGIGVRALFLNLTASNNIGIGNNALLNNTVGAANTALGLNAASDNIAGSSNVSIGVNALFSNRRGNDNIAIGREAGQLVGTLSDADTLMSSSILIGRGARNLATSQTNQIVIGHQGRGLGSNTTVLGNSATTQTWLGGSLTLGTQVTPAARLHVVGSGSTSSTWTAQFHNSAGNNNALMIRNDGNIGVGTNSPTDLIDINGVNGYSQLRLRTAYTPTGTADANGNTGDVSWDDNYIYIKTAAGWKRSALSTF